jgi:hypothetical protein
MTITEEKGRNMNRYNHGKIYKLVNSVDDQIYVGSTCNSLAKRKSEHKSVARRRPNRHVYQHLNSVGWNNVRIILIESVEAETKDQLLMREQHYIDLLQPTLNKNASHVDCPHGRQHNHCKDCGGVGICEHNKQKAQCKQCGGSNICEHNKFKSSCKQCLGNKYYCCECAKNFSGNRQLRYHYGSQLHKKRFQTMFRETFGELIPLDEIPTPA